MAFVPSSQTTMDSTDPTLDCPPGLTKLFATVLAPLMDELRQLRLCQEQHSAEVANLQSLVEECNSFVIQPEPAAETQDKLVSIDEKLDKLNSRLESLEAGGGASPLIMTELKSLREHFTESMGDIQSRLCALREDLPEPEKHTIKIMINDSIDKIDGMTVHEHFQAVRDIGGCFDDVISVKYHNNGELVTHDGKRREECFILIHFGSLEAEENARKDMAGVRLVFDLTDKSTVLPPVYVLEIEYAQQRGATGPGVSPQARLDNLVEGAFPHSTYGDLKFVSSFNHCYVETGSLKVAELLAAHPVKLKNRTYKIIPSLRQARPEFCHRCGVPGHKKYECTADERQCMKCSEDHDTESCLLTDRKTFFCSNCGKTGHGAFSPYCTHESSVREHHRARLFRKQGPYWARRNAAPPKKKRGRPSKADKAAKANSDLKRKRLGSEGKVEAVGPDPSDEESSSKRVKQQDGRNIEDMFNNQIRKSIENAKITGESPSTQAAASSSSAQGPVLSQESVGSSVIDGNASNDPPSTRKDASKKRKREDKGKGKAKENTMATDNEAIKARTDPAIPTPTPSQAVVNSESLTPSAPVAQPVNATSSTTAPPTSGRGHRSNRIGRKLKEADTKLANADAAGPSESTAPSAGTGPQEVARPTSNDPAKKERSKKRAGMKRRRDELKPASPPAPADTNNV